MSFWDRVHEFVTEGPRWMQVYDRKGEAERQLDATHPSEAEGEAELERITAECNAVDTLNRLPHGTTLSDWMDRHGLLNGPTVRDALRTPEQRSERAARIADAERRWDERDAASRRAAQDAGRPSVSYTAHDEAGHRIAYGGPAPAGMTDEQARQHAEPTWMAEAREMALKAQQTATHHADYPGAGM